MGGSEDELRVRRSSPGSASQRGAAPRQADGAGMGVEPWQGRRRRAMARAPVLAASARIGGFVLGDVLLCGIRSAGSGRSREGMLAATRSKGCTVQTAGRSRPCNVAAGLASVRGPRRRPHERCFCFTGDVSSHRWCAQDPQLPDGNEALLPNVV